MQASGQRAALFSRRSPAQSLLLISGLQALHIFGLFLSLRACHLFGSLSMRSGTVDPPCARHVAALDPTDSSQSLVQASSALSLIPGFWPLLPDTKI